MSVYVPSISNKFRGKIKYGKDFSELLERELGTDFDNSLYCEYFSANCATLAYNPEYYGIEAVFGIEGKVYTSRVSHIRSLNNEEGDIGSCFGMEIGERKSKEDVVNILKNYGVILSGNRILRKFQMLKYSRIMDTDFLEFMLEKKRDQRLFGEINTPKRVAYFTVIQEEDEDALPIHKGQRIVPKRLTKTTSWNNERLLCRKEELQKYPIVEIR